MSTPTPATAPVPHPKEIPQVTDAYRKAHKAYVLASGLFVSWELIGITLDTKERWGIELKSPDAVPLILLTLMLYSGYKTVIEWLQCDVERRRNTPAKWDYRVSHWIAAAALGIAVFQYLSRIQLVDWLNRHLGSREAPSPQEVRQLMPVYIVTLAFVALVLIARLSVMTVRAWRTGKIAAFFRPVRARFKKKAPVP